MKIVIVIICFALFSVSASPFWRETAAVLAAPYKVFGVMRSCATAKSNKQKCELLDGCEWHYDKRQCFAPGVLGLRKLYRRRREKCNAITDEGVCKQITACKWKKSTCTAPDLLSLFYSRHQNEKLDSIYHEIVNTKDSNSGEVLVPTGDDTHVVHHEGEDDHQLDEQEEIFIDANEYFEDEPEGVEELFFDPIEDDFGAPNNNEVKNQPRKED